MKPTMSVPTSTTSPKAAMLRPTTQTTSSAPSQPSSIAVYFRHVAVTVDPALAVRVVVRQHRPRLRHTTNPVVRTRSRGREPDHVAQTLRQHDVERAPVGESV